MTRTQLSATLKTMAEETKPYQITLLFPPTFNQETLNKAIQKVKQLIINQGGSFSSEENPTPILKKTSYPINKYEEVFYLILNACLPSQIIEALNQHLNLEDELLRHLITVQKTAKSTQETIDYSKMVEKIEPIEKLKKIAPIPLESTESKTKEIPPVRKPTMEKKPKVKIEDLDKKLEEILNE